jgi:hypothetical protein
MAEPTDEQLWRSVERTVRDVLLPAIDDEWARAAAIQLAGVARYAAGRSHGRLNANAAELAGVLRGMTGNPLVADRLPASDTPSSVMAAVGEVLTAAVTDDGPAGDEVRAVLRPVVVRQLDDELEATRPLIPFFRGQLDD